MFSFIWNFKLSSKVAITLCIPNRWMKFPIAPHTYQHLILSVFWILAMLVGVQWYLIVICFSLMPYDIEHLIIRWFVICIFSTVRYLLRFLAYFLLGYVLSFLKKYFIYLFLERGKEKEREGEKHQCVVSSHMPPTGDLTYNACTLMESNWRPFGS